MGGTCTLCSRSLSGTRAPNAEDKLALSQVAVDYTVGIYAMDASERPSRAKVPVRAS